MRTDNSRRTMRAARHRRSGLKTLLRRGPVLAVVSALGVAALLAAPLVGLNAAPVQAATPGTWADPVDSYSATSQACANVLVIGVRGSGESDGFGGTETSVVNAVKSDVQAGNSSLRVRQVYLEYVAADMPVLGNDIKLHLEDLILGTQSHGADASWAYFKSVDTGVQELRTVLDDSLTRCQGREKWVLSGYSQGALVVSETLPHYGQGAPLAGAYLVADPANYPGRDVITKNQGTAPAWADGVYDLGLNRIAIPTYFSKVTYSFCEHNDVVCDTGDSILTAGGLSAVGIATAPFLHRSTWDMVQKAFAHGVNIHLNLASKITGKNLQPLVDHLLSLPVLPLPTPVPTMVTDANLKTCFEQAYAQQVGQPVTDLTPDQLAQVSQVTCDNVASLDGLQGATALWSLDINAQSGSAPIDLSPLADLKNLTWLDVHAGVSSLAPLAGITSLFSLSVKGNFSDLSPLRGLHLSGTQLDGAFSDVSPLGSQTSLVDFDLVSPNMTDLSPLSNLHPVNGCEIVVNRQLAPATVGTPFPLPTYTAMDGSSVDLQVSNDNDQTAEGAVTGGSVTWTGAGPGGITGLSQVPMSSDQICEFQVYLTQNVQG